ncbi:hypothetical protein FRAAL2381 [Frankia alni ACN14a]|uniref:Uncharacterized protein n=1 Tax=Frankia alni (strain DSM 45986 / CECT 9034 / ACN14a) TaxID=326424 RepID=Q0RN62_FRAAA|nr:hypothetical protein FRAAL2381 [Frankia alni ACN14a]
MPRLRYGFLLEKWHYSSALFCTQTATERYEEAWWLVTHRCRGCRGAAGAGVLRRRRVRPVDR